MAQVAIEGLRPVLRFGTAAPITGTWRVGDTIINRSPTTGDSLLWRCTTAGTPGTWEADFSRTPTAHAASHAPAQSDDLTTALSAVAVPVALGTAAAGTGTGFSRQGHVHPTTGLALAADVLKAYKPGNTTRNNTAARTADPDLSVTVAANTVYAVRAWLGYEATTTADISIVWTGPAGATMVWSGASLAVNATTTTSATGRGRLTAITSSNTMGGIGAGTQTEAQPIGTLTVGGTGGTFALTWAQLVAEVSDAILYAGSWIILTKLA